MSCTIIHQREAGINLLNSCPVGSWVFRHSSYGDDVGSFTFMYQNTTVQKKCNALTGATVIDFGSLVDVFGKCTAYAISLRSNIGIINQLIVETKHGYLAVIPNNRVIVIDELTETFSDLVKYLTLDESKRI